MPPNSMQLDLGGAAAGVVPGAPANYDPNNPGAGFYTFLSSTAGAIMVLASLLVLLYLIWGGIEWITSGGDSAKVQKARDKITQAIIGILVLASTFAIYYTLQGFLGIIWSLDGTRDN